MKSTLYIFIINLQTNVPLILAQQHFVKRGSYWLIRPTMVNKNVSHVIGKKTEDPKSKRKEEKNNNKS
jgi:hypothetical protein